MSPLPTGATLDRKEADRIAGDPTRLRESYEYWRRAFHTFEVDPYGNENSPAIQLARFLPDDRFDTLLPERRHLTTAADVMTDKSGCMVSAEDMAPATESIGASGLFDDLGAFAGATISAESETDTKAIARGIRASREIFDAVRRYDYCRTNADDFGLGTAECLALFRQEGALAVTPPLESYAHGPLIRTGFRCRTPTVSLFDGTAERDGFVLSYRFRGSTDALANPVSRSFDALYRNLLVIGGLDTIVLPRLSSKDDLYHFLKQARANPSLSALFEALLKDYRARLATTRSRSFNAGWKKTQQGFFDELSAGLLMTRLEWEGGRPKVLHLLEGLAQEMSALVDAHPVSTRGGGVTTLFLEDDDAGNGVKGCLAVMNRWYASRADPTTLYARRDRPRDMTGFERFSPFTTYLRFHSGDAIFLGIVLRCIVLMETLDKEWKKNRSRWGETFRDAWAASSWSKAEAKKLQSDLNKHWKPRVKQEDTWRHIGLVDALRSHPASPAWLTPAPGVSARLLKTADVAERTMNAIRDQRIQTAIELALEFTPIPDLLTQGIIPNSALRPVFAKSHSFERMRRVYQETMDAAGI